jgi:hypothetical protein
MNCLPLGIQRASRLRERRRANLRSRNVPAPHIFLPQTLIAIASSPGRDCRRVPQLSPAQRRYCSFNTWAFKREQPSDRQLMLATITRSLERYEPVSFVLYWGKGPRCSIGRWDIECLDFLSSLAGRVHQVYRPGARMKLIFTDTHARLNGYQQTVIARYFQDIEGGRLPAWFCNLLAR